MNKSIFYSVLVGVLLIGSLALAEDDKDVPTSTNTPASPSVRIQMQNQKDEIQKNIRDTKLDKLNLKAKTEDARELLKKEAEATKEYIQKQREEFNETIKIKRAELEDEIKIKREKLKTNLEKIKDERKKETVERIDQRIDALNEKMMKHFSGVLEKLGEMLIRISERADRASSEKGLDISAVRSAIEKANTAIASARSEIETQSGKTYTIKITTEDTLRSDVGKTRKTFGDDLAVVRDAVKNAHSAVKDTAVALAQLVIKPKVSPSPSASPTATPTE